MALTKDQTDRVTVLKDSGVKDKFAVRAVADRGLTEDDIRWNAVFNRPPHWKETVHPAAEVARREAYNRDNPDIVKSFGINIKAGR